ncbi:MAG: HAMP domain-containing histidine kinase [Candidatus Obscuribacterales bacterium]|nr:HAMP domain-containing histidine kinase [Candidatus Obscuribacterales bacterium]
MSVRKKGILLVSIPVVFQLLLTGLLGYLYSQAEQQALKESQARLLVIRSNNLLSAVYDAGQMLVVYTAVKDRTMYERWLVKKENLLQQLDSLNKLSVLSSSPDAYSRLIKISNKGVKVMDESYRRVEQNKSVDIYQQVPELKSFTDSIISEIGFVLTKDLKSQIGNTLSEERVRQLIASCLYAGIFIDISIAIALSQFFGASIEKRLNVISDNTRRVRERQELNPQVDGTDEIANLDEEFHVLTKELRESERLRSEFISMISHDMKAPLMSVELTLEQIERKLKTTQDESLNDELNSVNNNMRRVMGLIRDILDLERGASGKLSLELEELNLDDVFARVTMSVKVLAVQKNVTLAVESHEESVFADKRRLEQVLVNLLSNALKFAPEGSQVALRGSKSGTEVEIRVTDSGVGVPEQDRLRIFERFEQSTQGDTVRGDAGSGLGLAICKTIIDSHEGQIGYEPGPDGGSQFWIRLRSAD